MKTRKLLSLSVAVFLLLGAVQGAFAHDFWDNWAGKPWQRGDPGSTYQAWEFNENPGPQPVFSNNPYGIALMTIQHGQYPDPVPGPDGQTINTWHIGVLAQGPTGLEEVPGTVDLFIPNNPVPNDLKLVYIQITSDKYTLGNAEPSTYPGATSITHPGPIIKHGPSSWYTYNWLIEIRPNPEYERITFEFPYSTNISQIVVDTICTVPEPSAFASLGVSGLFTGLLAMRRRRR